MSNKIIHLNNLRKIITKEKKIGKKIVLCHGVFDLLHFGHINHFKNAKKNGDLLIVSIIELEDLEYQALRETKKMKKSLSYATYYLYAYAKVKTNPLII